MRKEEKERGDSGRREGRIKKKGERMRKRKGEEETMDEEEKRRKCTRINNVQLAIVDGLGSMCRAKKAHVLAVV